MMTSSARLFFAALMAGALAASGQTAGSTPETFGEAIDVRAVNVEAVVTSSSGERVRGLTAADFRLLVDGKEVPIDYFAEIADNQAAEPAVAAAEPGSAEPQTPVTGAVGRSLLIFIDESFSLPTDLEVVLRRLQVELAGLGPEDQVAVVAFDGQRLTVLSDWSRDRAAIGAVLEAARLRPAHGVVVEAERAGEKSDAAFLKEAEVAASGEDASVPLGVGPGREPTGLTAGRSSLETAALDSLAGLPAQSGSRLSRVGAAAIAALRSFSSAPGRKAALLLSGGWPIARAPGVFPRLVETANLLGYTLYPIDVAGIETPSVQVDARMGPVDLWLQTGSAMNLNTVYTFIAADYERDVEYGLELLARETGGKASLNSNRLAALDRVLTDTSSYYWLGFSPTWRADGRRHEIRVEVRRPGLEVRSRRSYTDLTREADRTMQMESRLVVGGALRERRLRVELGTPRLRDRRTIEVPVTLGVPADMLPPSLAPGRYTAELPLRVSSVDARAQRSDLPPLKLRIELDQPPPTSGYARFQTTLRLRRANQTLQLAVVDLTGGALVWGEAEVKVDDGRTARRTR
jgi:VWFA-related protein